MLFVHGVGAHSRLSSLLQAYQALRANIRSPEAPIGFEDPIPEWKLREFDDGVGTPHLKLSPEATTPGATESVYLYEVNYSALAGVVRDNQPLDLTGLIVGLDLAVNVARQRLKEHPVEPRPAGRYDIDDAALALTVQKLAGVFVAVTVPILGIPSLALGSLGKNIVAVFNRFFADIATFALDMNGEGLISAHVDRTVKSIVTSAEFKQGDAQYGRDILVIAAHSLGTVVAHSYIVRHGLGRDREVPARVLTFGSPIGLICWLWLFLDFDGMDFTKRDPAGFHYFTWNPIIAPPLPPAPPSIEWINVVNHLDPIATAFPQEYVDLGQAPEASAGVLLGGRVHQRFIDTGDLAGVAHTAYFDDRKGFLEILGRLCGLRTGSPGAVLDPESQDPKSPPGRSAGQHWKEVSEGLDKVRLVCVVVGLLMIGGYLGVIAWAWRSPWPMAFLLLFAWPPLTIGTIAFFQRLICSKPTKRTPGEAIETLPWTDWRSFPHRLRQSWRPKRTLEEELEDVLASKPGWTKKISMWLLSFAPTLVAMLLPVLVTAQWVDGTESAWLWFKQHWTLVVPGMLVLFTFYLIAFAAGEFAAHWRAAVGQATTPRVPAPPA